MGLGENLPHALTWGSFFPSSGFSIPRDLIVLHWTPWFWVFREGRCRTWARFGGSTSLQPASQWWEHNHMATPSCKRGWEVSSIFLPRRRRKWSWQTESVCASPIHLLGSNWIPTHYSAASGWGMSSKFLENLFFHLFIYIVHKYPCILSIQGCMFYFPLGIMSTCRTNSHTIQCFGFFFNSAESRLLSCMWWACY